MKEEKLKELLSKYFEGTTSLQEEEELRFFFSGNEVPAGFEIEKEIFGDLARILPSIQVDPDLSSKIISSIDLQKVGQGRNPGSRSIFRIVSGIAATLLIVAGSYFFFLNKSDEIRDTYDDPQIAYEEAMKILNEVSSRLNKGTSSLKPIGKLYASTDQGLRKVENTTSKMEKSLSRLEVIGRLNSGKNNLK